MHPLIRRDLHPDRYGTHQPDWTPHLYRDGWRNTAWVCRICGRTTTHNPTTESRQ